MDGVWPIANSSGTMGHAFPIARHNLYLRVCMMNKSLPNAIDVHVDDHWCYVTCVTDDRVAYACLKKSQHNNVRSTVESGGDLIELMNEVVPLGHRVKIVPLDRVDTIEWHADDADVVFKHWNEENTKLVRTSASLRDASSRAEIIQAVKEGVGVSFIESDAKASIWHVGITQLALSFFAILLFIVPGIVGLFSPGEIATESRGRYAAIKEMIKELYNAVGPAGMLLIGVGICIAMMIWWYVAYRFPPKKTVAKATSSEEVPSLS